MRILPLISIHINMCIRIRILAKEEDIPIANSSNNCHLHSNSNPDTILSLLPHVEVAEGRQLVISS